MRQPDGITPRILHLAESAQGGVGTYLTEILPDQIERFGEHNVRALVPAMHAGHLSGVDRRQLSTWRRGGRGPMALMRFAAAVRRDIAAFRPTIVHAHSSVAGGVLRLMPRRGLPPFAIVYCPHGWAFDRSGSALRTRLIERIERDLAPYADRIVAISEHERREALRIGIAEDRIALVLNGIADIAPVRAARWDDARLKLLFIGRMDEQKGFDTLLDAVEPLHQRVAVRAIGRAVADVTSTAAPRRTHVERLGWRSLSEIATEIAAADVVVMPSRWEGFGLVALEAMRGGCAVVASAVGGLREIVIDGVTGFLVPPDSPERLMRVLAEPSLDRWKAMGAAGRERFAALYTAERMNAQLERLYEDLAPAASVVRLSRPASAHA